MAALQMGLCQHRAICAHRCVASPSFGLRVSGGRCDPCVGRLLWCLLFLWGSAPCWQALRCCLTPLMLCLTRARCIWGIRKGASEAVAGSCCLQGLISTQQVVLCMLATQGTHGRCLLAAAANSCCTEPVSWLRPASVLPQSQCWRARMQHQAAMPR